MLLTREKTKKLYSFDIFDTLITRRVGVPSGIFALIQEKISKDSDLREDLKRDFYNIRIECEKSARDIKRTVNDSVDILFEDIYSYMQKRYNLSTEKTQYLKNLEFDTEIENIVPIEENINKLKTLISEGERVVLISDMYFSSEILHKILSHIDPIFNDIKIYVSSEQNSAKWDGSLYKKVREEEGVKYKNWKHFGDNENSDYKNPRKLGIKSEHFNYPKLLHYEKDMLSEFPNNAEYQLLTGASRLARLNRKVTKNIDKYNFGASLAGPLLFNYINNVIDEAQKQGFKTLHFIARDGYIPIMVADAIIKERKLSIKTKYIYASRLVWRVPSKESYETFIYAMIQDFVHKMTFRFLAKRFNVEPDVLNDKFFHYKNIDILLSDEERLKIKEILLNNSDVRKYILETNKKTLDMSIEYIKQELDLSTNTIALVDINGTGLTNDILAYHINSIKPCNLYTFYFSYHVAGTVVDTVLSKKNAYLTKPKPCYFYLEILYRAPYGQTIGYKKNADGIIEPILEDCYKEALYKWGFEEYLQGILDFTNNLLKVRNHINNEDFCYYYFDYLTTKIRPETAEIMGDVPFLGIGKEGNKVAGPKITMFQMIKLLLSQANIHTVTECSHLSIARRNVIIRTIEANFAELLNQLPIITELKLYFTLRKLKKQNKKVMLWGASLFLESFVKKYNVHNDNIVGVIDKNPMRKGTKWASYQVYAPSEIKNNKPDYILLTIKNRSREIYYDVDDYIRQNYPEIEFGPNIFV